MIVTYPQRTDYEYKQQFNELLPAHCTTLVIFLSLATFELGIPELVSALEATRNQHKDGVILYLYGESPPTSFWRTASNIIRQCYGIERVAVADHGTSIEDPEYFVHIPFNFLNLFRDEQVVAAQERKHCFCSFNRSARSDRVRLVYKFKQYNILHKGAVTLGSDGAPFQYRELVDDEFLKALPLQIDDLGKDITLSAGSILAPMKKSIINVIPEGSIVQIGNHTVEDSYIRPLVSEKTAKAFACNQLPIWLATPGFVAHIRRKGFDVFDDIIDHSYDSELHTVKRIDMIGNEVKRLVDMGIITLRNLLEQHWERLEHNKKHVVHVTWENDKDVYDRLSKFYKR